MGTYLCDYNEGLSLKLLWVLPFLLPSPYKVGITFLFSVMSGVMARCDNMAANADTRGIERVNYLALLALGTFYFCVRSCQSISALNTPKQPLMFYRHA